MFLNLTWKQNLLFGHLQTSESFNKITKSLQYLLSFRHGVVTVVKRTISGDKMNVTMECKGTLASAVFKRM